jgi:hypothetical protein
MVNVVPIRGAQHPPKASQSKMETLIITPRMVDQWRIPPFQRPLRVNAKVLMVAEQIKQSECVEGVLTLGTIRTEHATYLYIVDGQHRIEAFKLSGIDEAIADVRVVVFQNMAEMAEEFVQLNSSLVKMRPDDILRGLEATVPALRQIRKSCEFVGYDNVRRGGTSPIVSMSALLRCWAAGTAETPAGSSMGTSVASFAQNLDGKSLQNLIAFLAVAFDAWKRDPEYFRLWGNLNLAMCMWLWNKLVIDRDRSGNTRYALLDIPQFKRCLMSVSADSDYVSWLHGRSLGDRDRSPCYTRLKDIFRSRLLADRGSERKKPTLPQPAWATSVMGKKSAA